MQTTLTPPDDFARGERLACLRSTLRIGSPGVVRSDGQKVAGDIAAQPWLEASPEEPVCQRGFNGGHIVACQRPPFPT